MPVQRIRHSLCPLSPSVPFGQIVAFTVGLSEECRHDEAKSGAVLARKGPTKNNFPISTAPPCRERPLWRSVGRKTDAPWRFPERHGGRSLQREGVPGDSRNATEGVPYRENRAVISRSSLRARSDREAQRKTPVIPEEYGGLPFCTSVQVPPGGVEPPSSD